MSVFTLFLSRDLNFKILKWSNPPPVDFNPPALGFRDPGVPIEWKPGFYYFNPLVSKQLYIYRSDGELANLITSQILLKKYLTGKYLRTWFELRHQPIGWEYLHHELKNMMRFIPHNTAEIAKGFLRHHSIRIPAEVNCLSEEDWNAFTTTYLVPISPILRRVLDNSSVCQISKATESEFVLDQVYVPKVLIRVRAFQVRTVTKKVRQIMECPSVQCEIPAEVASGGVEKITEWALANIPEKLTLNAEPMAEETIETEVTQEPAPGLAIWNRVGGAWNPLVTPMYARTLNNIIDDILDGN